MVVTSLSADYLLVGKISKPHGIKGELKIFPLLNLPADFLDYPEYILLGPDKKQESLTVVKARVQGKFVIIASKECQSRNRAEELSGSELWLADRYLAPLSANEFYWHKVMGKIVTSKDGEEIGILRNLLNTNGPPVMVIEHGIDEYLIPAQNEFIVSVDATGMIVDLPPGLLEINKKDC